LRQTLEQQDIASVISQVELGWKDQYEKYYQRRFTTQYLPPDGIQLRLANLHKTTGQKTALIYALPGPDRLDLILLLPMGKPIHRIVDAADNQALSDVAQEFRIQLVNPASTPAEYLPPAQQLYNWLMQPIVADLQAQQIDTLILCLGKGLRGLPLAALHDGQKFLAEQYNLAIIPAFNLLDHRPSTLYGTQVLAMGASKFQDNQPLPAVPLELNAITQRHWSGEVLLNQAFTLKDFAAARARHPFGIVHLATHASISANSVQDSYIQFWDQRLSLDAVQSLKLRAPVVQLLVLSACQTALGNANAELGFAGFAVQSGAKAAIASLWQVSDIGTLVLMNELYKYLGTTAIKSQALRQAQIALLQGNITIDNSPILRGANDPTLQQALQAANQFNLKHPYYWAAFTLIGNPW
jgi:CHAT domain-containing protein